MLIKQLAVNEYCKLVVLFFNKCELFYVNFNFKIVMKCLSMFFSSQNCNIAVFKALIQFEMLVIYLRTELKSLNNHKIKAVQNERDQIKKKTVTQQEHDDSLSIAILLNAEIQSVKKV